MKYYFLGTVKCVAWCSYFHNRWIVISL
jgi:hypothetical protein